MTGIADRSIIMTGGASGIGAAAARLFADNGALLTIADVDQARGDALVAELNGGGRHAQFIRTDISSEDDVKAMVAAAEAAYGRLDGAFNNAALPNTGKLLADTSYEEFNRMFAVNTVGTFLCVKHEVIAMSASARARSSTSGQWDR